MREKHSNILILFIVILIIALGSVYYVKSRGNSIDSTYSENSGTNDGYEYNNRYYYNQLNDCSKAIYDTIVNNLDKIQRGNCIIQVDYNFNYLLKSENGGKLLDDYYNDAVNAINLDIPNLFYLDFQKLYINIEKTSTIFFTKYKVSVSSNYYEN